MKKLLLLTKTLLAAALLCVGQNAWGQVTPYSNDYEGETPNVDWTSGNTGRYTVTTVTENENTYLRSNYQTVSNNNGAVITCSATNGKVTAGTDFYMSFDLWLRGANTKNQNASFYVYDSGNNASTPILKITQNNTADVVDYNNWTVNGATSLTIDNSNWYNYVITRIGSKEYLTVIKKSDSSKVLDMVEITSLSTNGGLGKLVFNTAKAWAHHAIDNVVVRALDAPAFTLSTTEVTPEVSGNATVNVTGINGTVSVSSDNTSIATATYSDGTITINGVANGVAYITVTAIKDGAKTTQTITATVGAVATTTVTVNYLCGGSPIAEATTIEDVAIGSNLTASDITYSETIAGVGCRYVNPSFSVDFPYTVVENGVINVNYTQQNSVSTLKIYGSVAGNNYLLHTYDLDGKYVGDAVAVTYPEYYVLNGTIYSTANKQFSGSDFYSGSFTLTGTDPVLTYNKVESNVVYYAEAENISGATSNSGGNANIRCSDAKGAYFEAETNIVTLPAGRYTIYTQVWGNTGVTFTFKAGEKTIREHSTTGSLNPGNSSFTLTESTTIKVSASGQSGKVLDLIYIVKTGDVATIGAKGYTTFSSSYPLNLDEISGGTAYKVVSSGVTEKVVTPSAASGSIAAGEGLILSGDPGASVTIPVVASGDAISGNLMIGCPTGATLNSETPNYGTCYVLVNGTTEAEFKNLTNWIEADKTVEIPAGKAYLNTTASNGARSMRLSFGDITGVANVEAAAEAKAQDGKFIENGKLVIIKNGVKYNAAGAKLY